MYFQLLHGIHIHEDGTRYEVEYEQDDQGQARCVKQPMFASQSNLVANFGSDKFRLVPVAEAEAILGKAKNVVGRKQKTSDPATPKKKDEPEVEDESEEKDSDLDKAAKEGASEIADPPGKEVTNRFTGAETNGMRVYRKGANKYVVTSMKDGADVFLTEEPIVRKEVEKLIEEWSE